jgi:two-component system, sensor histidine kinase PdtaS
VLLRLIFILFFFTTLPATAQQAYSWQPADTALVNNWLLQAAAKTNTQTSAALTLAQKAYAAAEQINYTNGVAAASVLMGGLLSNGKDYLEATTYLEKAKLIYQNAGNEVLLAQVLKQLGDVYAARSYFRQSSDSYREAAPLLRKTGQTKLLSDCTEGIGTIAATFGRYKNAALFFQRSLVMKQGLHEEKGISALINKLSLAHLNARQYDSALYFIEQLKHAPDVDAYLITEALSNESMVYSFTGKLLKADSVLLLADKKLPPLNNNAEKIKICIAKTVYGMAKEDKSFAKLYFDSTGRLLTGSRNPEMAFTGFNYLAEINSIKGDYKTAYNMLRQAEIYKDLYRTDNIDRLKAAGENASEISLQQKEIEYLNLLNKLKASQLGKEAFQRLALLRENIIKDSSIAKQELMMLAMETETNLRTKQWKQEKELSLSLSRENKLKQQLLMDERSNKRILWLMLLGTGLLGTVIYYQYQKQKKKNSIIKKQAAELEVLNKEIHHRVKNNLQVISSMLDLQSQTLTDERGKAIIKEGIQRVQSMAFIHQNLYQGNAVNSVNMNEYIKMLSNHLFQTYNIGADKIELHTCIENLNLHTDTAIPLGMILNELISNALKYAFKGRESGAVWVTMKKNDNELLLQVKDNGVGLQKDFNPHHTSSFGYEIIKAFLQKMKARMNVDGSHGTDVQIIISKFKTTA